MITEQTGYFVVKCIIFTILYSVSLFCFFIISFSTSFTIKHLLNETDVLVIYIQVKLSPVNMLLSC